MDAPPQERLEFLGYTAGSPCGAGSHSPRLQLYQVTFGRRQDIAPEYDRGTARSVRPPLVKLELAGRIEDNSAMVPHDQAHIDQWIVDCRLVDKEGAAIIGPTELNEVGETFVWSSGTPT